MKIRRYPLIVTVLWILVGIADIIFAITSFMKINFSDKKVLNINNPHIFNVMFAAMMLFAIVQFYTVIGHYEFSHEGVTFRLLFYHKSYLWEDFRYIVKLHSHRHIKNYELKNKEKVYFLFSIQLDKENISSINSIKDQSGIFFRLRYSEELEELIHSHTEQYIENINV